VQTNNTRERSTGISILNRGVSTNPRTRQRQNSLVVQESAVLLGIEHLKESASRVTVDSLTDLVDFIDEYQRILDSNALECLDYLSGQGSVDT